MIAESNNITPPEQGETEEVFTDLRIILNNLAGMFQCLMNLSSDTARVPLAQSFIIELSFVTLKLKSMRQRWQLYLPFKEAIDVKFKKQLQVAESWLVAFGDDQAESDIEYEELIPDNGYLLDMMGYEVEPIKSGLNPDELKTAVQSYCKKVDNMLNKYDLSEWETIARNRLEPEVQHLMNSTDSDEEVFALCIRAIKAFVNELKELEDFFYSELKEEQFMVLANRLIYRDCKEALKQAHQHVKKEKSTWPKPVLRDRAIGMKTEVKLRLMQDGMGEQFKEYIDMDYPDLLKDARFGQFLFRYRHELKTEDVQTLVMCCTIIEDLNLIIDPDLKVKRAIAKSVGRELNEEEKAIHKKLLALADKAEWRGGATLESIKMGIGRMLGVGYQLEPDMQPLSEALWKLLKERKNCDAEKSLKVTWLNIVGWCVNQRFLTGGSPALCKTFFTRCGMDDYKAIDKGKNPPKNFQKVEPLLKAYLK